MRKHPHTLPQFWSLSLSYKDTHTHTHTCKCAAQRLRLDPYNLRNRILFPQSKSQVVASSNHLIKNISVDCLLHLTAISSFDINPSLSNSSMHFFLFLYGPEGIYCSARLFTSKRPRSRCPISCSPAVFTIVHLRQIV